MADVNVMEATHYGIIAKGATALAAYAEHVSSWLRIAAQLMNYAKSISCLPWTPDWLRS